MRLLLIRNGKTEDRECFARSGHAEDLRPLSQEGRRDLRRAAGGLAKVVGELDRLVSSPLVRAIETAAIFAKSFPKTKSTEASELRPGGRIERAVKWVESCSAAESIGLVGHEPQLGRLASILMCGKSDPRTMVAIKRGGMCLLEFPGKASAGQATLRWLLTPRQLRLIARRS